MHTLGHNGLLPYAEFEQHPESFALVNGRRFKGGQPCMTHPDLLRLIVRNAGEWIRKKPEARIRGGGEVYEDLVKWARISPRVWVWYYAHGGDKMHPVPPTARQGDP